MIDNKGIKGVQNSIKSASFLHLAAADNLGISI